MLNYTFNNNQHINNLIDTFITKNIIHKSSFYTIPELSAFILKDCLTSSIRCYSSFDNSLIEEYSKLEELCPRQQKINFYDFTLSDNIDDDIQFNINLLETGNISYIKINNSIFRLVEVNGTKYFAEFILKYKNFDIYDSSLVDYIRTLDKNTQNVIYKVYIDLTKSNIITKFIHEKFHNIVSVDEIVKYLTVSIES